MQKFNKNKNEEDFWQKRDGISCGVVHSEETQLSIRAMGSWADQSYKCTDSKHMGVGGGRGEGAVHTRTVCIIPQTMWSN